MTFIDACITRVVTSRIRIALIVVAIVLCGCGREANVPSGVPAQGGIGGAAGTGDIDAGGAGGTGGISGAGGVGGTGTAATGGAGSAGTGGTNSAGTGGVAGSQMNLPDAGADASAGGPGVCGGDRPHGCYVAQPNNPMGCPPQIHEQSAYYPPGNEWVACSSPNYVPCNYARPDGSIANCACDLGVHWLCTY